MASVLFVDDSHLSRTIARLTLTHAGHTLIEADDGVAGLDLARTQRPHCIVIAYDAPSLDAPGFLARFCEESTNTPVIVLTACARRKTINQCLNAGATSILDRAHLERDLVDAINQAIARPDCAAA